jgi:hypothetical protein
MSRSGYSDDCSGGELNLWRGAVNQAIKGKRGQAFLRETLAALDAMPEKRLTTDSLHEPETGQFCTLGAVGAARGMDMKPLQYSEREGVAKAFGISEALAAEIMFENDEASSYWPCNYKDMTPERRWVYMRAWVVARIVQPSGDQA